MSEQPFGPSVGGPREAAMSNLNSSVSDVRSVAAAPARLAAILSSFLLGAFVLAGAGFASTPALHNAAHDQRHSIGFPCH